MTLGGSSAGGEHRRLGAIFIKSGGGQAGILDSGERVYARSEGLMVEYLVVALQHPSGGWVAVLPDFVGVTGRAVTMQHAIDRATAGAREVCAVLVGISNTMPEPCDLATAQKNLRWAKEYGIDWEHAVVQPVPISSPGTALRRRAQKRESKVVEWSRRMAANRANQTPPRDRPYAAE